MTTGPERFRLLATFVAHRPVDVAEAHPGEPSYTNGEVIFVSSGRPADEQRREVMLQSALLGGGSLDPQMTTSLRARPRVARRYLALEGRRVLGELVDRVPLAAALQPECGPTTKTADESLVKARGRAEIADPPEWFGVIRPSRLRATAAVQDGAAPTDRDLRTQIYQLETPDETDDDDDDDGRPSEQSKILKLFEAPVSAAQSLADYFRKMLGSSRSSDNENAGGHLQVRASRRARAVGSNVRPLPTRIQFTDDDSPGATVGVAGALYPEWDVHGQRYKPDWCRVVDFDLTDAVDVSAGGVVHDEVLRRRLSRIGLGPKTLRRRPDGDELDLEALIDLFVDLRSGHSPAEHVYSDRRQLERNLGVLILLDASGSATDTDADGLAVHEHQRRAAATMAATLEELGDRVAVYAFRSHGRHAVQLPAIKTFGQRFGALARARLNQVEPSGYTRLGAGIRGAGEILKMQAGTPNRLLVVLSDGYPYDAGYEGRYAEADARKALEELRADGIACLCLSVGADMATDALERAFGSASHASAATLADLSPKMDELFGSALAELAAPRP
ncbi:nitric oxide reductase activation protein NorD [Mycobacterium sp. NPDC051804]|uniref:nitric oxide reductase activation protein NorD n=1 Tax=Mycobacterium sp. NPDC051804 TaxID=3364295 RepID=UPI0037BB5450